MTYLTGEAQIISLLQSGVGSGNTWTAANSISVANDTNHIADAMANTGASHHYLFAQPGPFKRRRDDIALTVVVTTWTTFLSLMAVVTPKTNPLNTLVTDREAILDVLDTYSRLNAQADILDAFGVGGYQVQQRTFGTARGKQQFLFVQQLIQVDWEEESRVTQND